MSNSNLQRNLSPLSVVTISAPKPARGLPPRIYSEPFLAIPANIDIADDTKEAFDDFGIPQRCKDWFGDDDFDVRKVLGNSFSFLYISLSIILKPESRENELDLVYNSCPCI